MKNCDMMVKGLQVIEALVRIFLGNFEKRGWKIGEMNEGRWYENWNECWGVSVKNE